MYSIEANLWSFNSLVKIIFFRFLACVYLSENRGEEEDNSSRNQTHFTNIGELDDQPAFHQHDVVDLSPSILLSYFL